MAKFSFGVSFHHALANWAINSFPPNFPSPKVKNLSTQLNTLLHENNNNYLAQVLPSFTNSSNDHRSFTAIELVSVSTFSLKLEQIAKQLSKLIAFHFRGTSWSNMLQQTLRYFITFPNTAWWEESWTEVIPILCPPLSPIWFPFDVTWISYIWNKLSNLTVKSWC